MHKVIVLVGSNRSGSVNQTLANAIIHSAGDRLSFTQADLSDLPIYNEDLWAQPPEAVLALKAAVRAADAVLLVTPEYNRSVTPLLKNAIDWGSRPYGDSCWEGKPAAIVGASPGATGTAAAQSHLRGICGAVGMVPLAGQPEYMIQFRGEAYASDGSVSDEGLRGLIDGFVDRFATHISRLAD